MVIAPLFNHHTSAIFLHNTTDFINRFVKKFFDTFHIFWFNRKHETNTHVEDFKHFFVFDLAIFFKSFKNWKDWHFAFINFSSQVICEHTRYIFDETTTCDVGNSIHQFFFDEWQSRFDVDTSWLQKNVFQFFSFQFWENFFTCVIRKDTTNK